MLALEGLSLSVCGFGNWKRWLNSFEVPLSTLSINLKKQLKLNNFKQKASDYT